jgi:hypothetical protein
MSQAIVASPAKTKSRSLGMIAEVFAFAGLLNALFIFIVLPAIPSPNGPVHLYYSMVVRALLHKDSFFLHWYLSSHIVSTTSS